MTGHDFLKKMKDIGIRTKMGVEDSVIPESVKLIQEFCNDLSHELSQLLSDKGNSSTALLISDILRSYADAYGEHKEPQGLVLKSIYDLSFKTEKVEMVIPSDKGFGD